MHVQSSCFPILNLLLFLTFSLPSPPLLLIKALYLFLYKLIDSVETILYPILEFLSRVLFSYRKTGYKKKLNSFIQFPDTLDMKDHVKSEYIGKHWYFLISLHVQATLGAVASGFGRTCIPFFSVTELKCSYSKIYRDPGWKNQDLGNEASSLSHIRTNRKFYKGFRGKARSRKPRQPGQTRSCEEATSLAHYL